MQLLLHCSSQVAQSTPAKQETQVQPLGREDPLEEGMATYSSILAWRTKEPGGLWSMELQRVGHDLVTKQQQVYLIREMNAF